MEENLKEGELKINKNLKYGKFSRKIELLNYDKIYKENRFYGLRLGEIFEVKYDKNNNPILINEDGTKLIDTFSNNEEEEEKKFEFDNSEYDKKYNNKNKLNYIGRKRYNTNYNERNILEEEGTLNNNRNDKKKKENNEEKCPNCNFIYFEFMDFNEKNEHVNACLNGNGKRNIESFKKTNEFLEREINLELEKNPNCCPFCHKIFKKNIKQHQKACIKKFDNDDN